MAAAPVFVGTPKAWAVSIATANTNRDGTGTLGTLMTAGASGSKIERIDIDAAVTTTAGVVRVFVHDGTNFFLLDEQLVTAITPSATVAVFSAVLTYPDLVLPTGWSIRVSTHNAETFHVKAFGGDF